MHISNNKRFQKNTLTFVLVDVALVSLDLLNESLVNVRQQLVLHQRGFLQSKHITHWNDVDLTALLTTEKKKSESDKIVLAFRMACKLS